MGYEAPKKNGSQCLSRYGAKQANMTDAIRRNTGKDDLVPKKLRRFWLSHASQPLCLSWQSTRYSFFFSFCPA
jgi:hypothetical protein